MRQRRWGWNGWPDDEPAGGPAVLRRGRGFPLVRLCRRPGSHGSSVVGVTPLDTGKDRNGSRQREVEAWLRQQRREGARWVALDDIPELYRPGACLVITDDGFREKESGDLRWALADPESYAETHPVSQVPSTTLWLPAHLR